MEELDGKVALVTGASGGIGAAVAKSLADHGVRVGLASRSGDDLGIDGSVAAPCDVRDAAAIDGLVGQVVERFGRPRHPGRERRGRRVRAVPGARPRSPGRDDRHQREGHDLRVARVPAAPAEQRPRRLRHGRLGGGPPRPPVRGGLLRVQVRAGGVHPGHGPRAASAGVRCTNICPGGVATEFAMGRGRTPDMPELPGMMSADDVAEAVLFAVTRPRNHRILEMAFRPVTEGSWG